jgi:AraC-like DNA-binding protein
LYNALLQKLSLRYVKKMNQYFSDTVQLKPQWAKKNFYFAAFFGVLSIVSSLFKDVVIDIWFTVLFAVYYIFFALRYMDYNRIFSLLENDFFEELTSVEPISTEKLQTSTSRKFDWIQAKEQIIQDKLYLQQGITIQHLAEYFNTNRTTFSSCLNKNERQNFNTFINELRINYAQEVLSEQPQLPLSEVALKCGFSEQSNFSRQFRLISGVSPVQWLKNQKHNEH